MSRGSEYSRRASATCRPASRVCARSAKTSRMTSCLSMTARPAISSQFRCCPGERAASKTITLAPSSFACRASSRAFPSPRSRAGDFRRSLARVVRVTSKCRFSTSSVSSARSSSPSPSGMSGVCTPMRKARCTGDWVSVDRSIGMGQRVAQAHGVSNHQPAVRRPRRAAPPRSALDPSIPHCTLAGCSLAWWCKGSTGDFDSPSPGSNPGRAGPPFAMRKVSRAKQREAEGPDSQCERCPERSNAKPRSLCPRSPRHCAWVGWPSASRSATDRRAPHPGRAFGPGVACGHKFSLAKLLRPYAGHATVSRP